MPLSYILVVALILTEPTRAGKISSGLLSKLQNGEKSNAILELPSVLGNVLNNPTLMFLKGAAKADMMETLMKRATSASQAPFLSALQGLGLAESTTPFWISNDIALNNVDLTAVESLRTLPGTFTLREPVKVSVNSGVIKETNLVPRAKAEKIQWGVEKIGAPAVWAAKTKGENIVVANIDTGVFLGHESLRDNYAGKWFDATGESNLTIPNDLHMHGTHTMGTLCGRTSGIGVAPNSKWIACKGIFASGASEEKYVKICGQWIFQQRPHVVSNSWAISGGNTFYNDIVTSWRAVGIIPVFAMGNWGDRCRTVGSPADQPNLISVGSTRSNDTMSTFSSRGYSRGGAIKPELTAPGEDILSGWHDKANLYLTLSGTSSACPSVAGAIALILSANPSWTYDMVFSALTRTADHPPVDSKDLSCGNTTTSNYPNNAYGFGRINVKKALGL